MIYRRVVKTPWCFTCRKKRAKNIIYGGEEPYFCSVRCAAREGMHSVKVGSAYYCFDHDLWYSTCCEECKSLAV